MCACVRARECACVCARARTRVNVRVCVCVCARACVCAKGLICRSTQVTLRHVISCSSPLLLQVSMGCRWLEGEAGRYSGAVIADSGRGSRDSHRCALVAV